MIDVADPVAAALAWIEGDPDEGTQRELRALIDSGDLHELAERMAGTLEFGTAGIRGAVEAGSNRMNRAVVIKTTRGLADWLLARHDAPVVAIGADARLSSRAFLEDAIGVLAAAGVRVRYFDGVVPTPIVAFASRELGTDAAVVITASHNPPQDNGYKVYAANHAQIVPPTDAEIAAAIDAVGPANEVPRLEWDAAVASDLTEEIPSSMVEAYDASSTSLRFTDRGSDGFRVVYTPLHGVGGEHVTRQLEAAGYTSVSPVPQQYEPDGHFPTVSFPNPEEPGALDLAKALAAEGAELIVANDPDADRLAAAVPVDDEFRTLSGNQIGLLLADYVLGKTDVARPLVVNSIVSSPMLGAIAAAHGARWEQTLTGFKWIWNAALDLADDATYVFGFEEALGYSVGPFVRDKDGIATLVVFVDMAAELASRGSSVLGRWYELAAEYGLWVSTQKSVVRPGSEGAAEIAAAMDRIKASRPDGLAGFEVIEAIDFSVGAEDRPRWLPATDLVELSLGDAGRVLVRPSGTEPKLKIYVDLRATVGGQDPSRLEGELLDTAQRVAAETATFLGIG